MILDKPLLPSANVATSHLQYNFQKFSYNYKNHFKDAIKICDSDERYVILMFNTTLLIKCIF